MAYKENIDICGRSVYQPYDVAHADGQNNVSVNKVFSMSCSSLLDEFQEMVTPSTVGVTSACQAGGSSYTNHSQHTTDSNTFTSLDHLTDNHGGSYNTLNNVEIMNSADTFFESPSVDYASCKLGLSRDSVGPSRTLTHFNPIWTDRYTDDEPKEINQTDPSHDTEPHAYKIQTLPFSQSSVYEGSEQQLCDSMDPQRLLYDNDECHAPVYFTGIPNVCPDTNRLAHLDGSVSCHFIETENGRSQQNEATARRNNTSQYLRGFKTGSNRMNRDEHECRNYHHDVSHPHTGSSLCLIPSSDEYVAQTITANEQTLHVNTTAHHFLLEDTVMINSTFHPSEHSETGRRETVNLNESLADVRENKILVHHDQGYFSRSHTNSPSNEPRLCRHTNSPSSEPRMGGHNKSLSNEPRLSGQACDESKMNKKNSLKARSKKTDCVENLQHQLELLEENRRKGRSQNYRYYMEGSDQQKTGVDNMASIIDVDHMISSGVTVAGFKPRAIIRKRNKTHTPGEVKNLDYWQKRRKNNDSARKSRESKKEKEKNFYKRALELEYENIYLHECLRLAEAELTSLGHQFIPPTFDHQSFYYCRF